ncbi:MAG: FAD-dependent oxidoreductase, partial [Thermoguttaceae bacterium]|nr:FAD-dependent oxidoreductase [Thermoguttaceae bacterium]
MKHTWASNCHVSREMTRRTFLGTGALAVPVVASSLTAAEVPLSDHGPGTPGVFTEPARGLPLHDDADVIVCGGGPAGVAAAVAAARAGARTRLFELHGSLGGVWTTGLLTYIFDFNKPGLAREIVARLDARDARRGDNRDRFVYEPDEMKVLLEEMCAEAGVKFLLHTRVAAAYREEGRLATIVTESKSGREAWWAPVFIDATGDGDLGAQAGCEWDTGQAKDCPCQPLTLNALAVVRDAAKMGDFISFFAGNDRWHVEAT